MELKDFFITPVWLILIYTCAFFLQKKVTNKVTRKYFFKALHLKIIGGLGVGFIYQFYYGGGRPSGDTFHYFYHSGIIWDALWDDSFSVAMKLIFGKNEITPEIAQHVWKMEWYKDDKAYFVVRFLAFFDLFTLHTYSASACLFAFVSFTGVWAMYSVFYRHYPILHKEFAIAFFFVPSLFFWGSGILKDTISMGALGWMTYALFNMFVFKEKIIKNAIIFLVTLWIGYNVKEYIALCFIPTAILSMSLERIRLIKSPLFRYSFAPIIIGLAIGGIGFFLQKSNEESEKYSLDKISNTAEETARWIHQMGELEGGSVYSLGDFDYSPAGMLKKAPLAIWVSLFRPHLWEVRNPVMLLAALESLWFLVFTIQILWKNGLKRVVTEISSSPVILLCFSFSILFSLAVGISTYNFGSLVRYKIPMMPFYICGLYIIEYNFRIQLLKKKERKRLRLLQNTN